jgi:hypothetical protein
MKFLDSRVKTYLVFGLSALIMIIHTFHPVTLSPTHSGDRTMAMFVFLLLLVAARGGSASARNAVGISFVFFASVNFLIGIFYNVQNGFANFVELIFWGFALGVLGLELLVWKDIRFFEEKSVTQTAKSF